MRTKLCFAVFGLVVLCACQSQQTNDIQKAEWLIGTWENKTSEGSVYETWSKTGEKEYSGRSYRVEERDTVVFETIRLVHEQAGLFYIPTVKDENDDLPVRFENKTISETQLVFENLQHDFPQIISYTKISNDSLAAEISGIENGQKAEHTFSMKRVK